MHDQEEETWGTRHLRVGTRGRIAAVRRSTISSLTPSAVTIGSPPMGGHHRQAVAVCQCSTVSRIASAAKDRRCCSIAFARHVSIRLSSCGMQQTVIGLA